MPKGQPTKSCGCRDGRDLYGRDVRSVEVNLEALADACYGLEVKWPEPLPAHALDLMRTLGVTVTVRS